MPRKSLELWGPEHGAGAGMKDGVRVLSASEIVCSRALKWNHFVSVSAETPRNGRRVLKWSLWPRAGGGEDKSCF